MALINRMWAAPNIVCVCVDKIVDGLMEGRLYHRYSGEHQTFTGMDPVIKYMDELFEKINYPQSAVRERSFETYIPEGRKERIEPLLSSKELEDKEGLLMTLLVNVRFRQRATWQGWLYYKEKDELVEFDSELDLIKSMDYMCHNTTIEG